LWCVITQSDDLAQVVWRHGRDSTGKRRCKNM